jgi:hypothetical protein
MNPLPVLRKLAEEIRMADLKKLQEALEKPKPPVASTHRPGRPKSSEGAE